MVKMGLQFGLEKDAMCPKRAFRWLFKIPMISCDDSPNAVNALPPEKSARPNLSFKEMDVNHLIEDVYYPAKPDWKPISLTLFDFKKEKHPVFEWIKEVYKPKDGQFFEALRNDLIKECELTLYSGCGEPMESWIFEDCWPQAINFNTLDMTSSAIVMVDITLRYARAYITEPPPQRPQQALPGEAGRQQQVGQVVQMFR